MFDAALTIGFNPHLEKYLEGHVGILHPLEGSIKTLKPYSFALCSESSYFVLVELRARSHERPVTTFKHLALHLQLLCYDCWEKSLMVLVFLSVEQLQRECVQAFLCGSKVVLAFNLPLNTHSFCLRLVESIFLLFPSQRWLQGFLPFDMVPIRPGVAISPQLQLQITTGKYLPLAQF